MKKYHFLLPACWLLLMSFSARATNFYLSGSGDDAKDGRSPATAWRSITKLNASMSQLQPGDSVLFRRGDTFRGQITLAKSGTASAKINFGAYGSGENPVITAAVPLGKTVSGLSSQWVPVDGKPGLWRCYYKTDALALNQLFVEGDNKMIARYPNEGYFFADNVGTRTSFPEAQIGKPDSFVIGSRMALRWIQDAWTNVTVTGVVNGSITYTPAVRDPVKKASGYYFYGKLEMIDQEHEWYFNNATDSMYYQPPAGVDPNTLTIEASLQNYGIDTRGHDYLSFQDLTLIRAANSGVLFQNSEYVDFNKLTITDCFSRGFFSNNGANDTMKSTHIAATNCTVSDCNVNGFLLWRTTQTTIKGNTIKRIGLKFPGYQLSYAADGIITALASEQNVFSYNRIDSIAKNGIRTGGDNLVERNIITNVGFHAADLAGIYVGGGTSKGTVIRNNFVYNLHTNNESWGEPLPDSYRLLNPGLYNDIYGERNTWSKNTVFNTGAGILSQNELNTTYYKNVIYNVEGVGMLFIERGEQVGQPVGFASNNQLIGNVFYKKSPQGSRLFTFENKSAANDWGTFLSRTDSNYYFRTLNPDNIGFYTNLASAQPRYLSITFANWKARFPEDKSKLSFFTATAENPDRSQLLINPADKPLTVKLSSEYLWYDLDGNSLAREVVIEPWYSRVVIQGDPVYLQALHQDGDQGNITNNQLRPHFELLNTGQSPVALSEITFRYWLTAEEFAPVNPFVDWAQVGTANVKARYVALDQPRQGAFGYVEYQFTEAAGQLAPGASSGPIQTRIGKADWTMFNESDDYSYSNASSFQENYRITVYRKGKLIYGAEPKPVTGQTAFKVASASLSSTANTIRTQLQVSNAGNQPVNYADLSVRYWFTSEGDQPLNYWVDYAKLGSSNLKGKFVKLTTPLVGADTYLEVRVDAALGQLMPLSNTGEVQLRWAKSNWLAFNQTDDYSYLPISTLTENANMTVYYQGKLVYGAEPQETAVLTSTRKGFSPERSLQLYPNPTISQLVLRGDSSAEPIKVRILRANGQFIEQVQARYNEPFSVAHLQPGFYLLKIPQPQGTAFLKFIKQ